MEHILLILRSQFSIFIHIVHCLFGWCLHTLFWMLDHCSHQCCNQFHPLKIFHKECVETMEGCSMFFCWQAGMISHTFIERRTCLASFSTTGTPFWMKHIAIPPPILIDSSIYEWKQMLMQLSRKSPGDLQSDTKKLKHDVEAKKSFWSYRCPHLEDACWMELNFK